MRIDRFFDETARARVAQAVKAAEARTSGQIVPVVVERSRPYHGFWIALGGLLLANVAQLALALLDAPQFSLSSAALLCWDLALMAVAAIPMVRRRLVSPQFEEAVRQRAMVAFLEHGVHRTRDENGVLLFASLYERKVVVLGDRAVHAKLGEEQWKRAVASLLGGIRSGDAAGGFCNAIAEIGEQMARAFPRRDPVQPNELPDELQVDR